MVNRIDPAPAMGETRDGGSMPTYAPAYLPPPPQQNPRNDQRLTPQCWKGEGGGEGGGDEEITWTTAARQLIERPLGR